ncbi:MAG TPA: helix-hairpin-helix domain-containing protein [Gemmatimonadales bacterium]|nr:helix-hairpin-helix domain-containing protein [Gemmatimonadales bacterium]
MTREPRAVLLLLGLAIAGHAGRLLLARPGSPPGELLAAPAHGDADPARQKARARQLARPLQPHETVDINRAPAEEIARLPRIGMSLAKRIVQDRLAHGPFRGLRDLDRVPGVGPGLLATLQERLSFEGGGAEVPTLPDDANLRTPGAYAQSGPPGGETPIDLNSASEADLVALPGIGPSKARAILAYRREKGSFAAVSDLGRVPGFGRSLVARLTPLLTAR